MIIRSNEKFSFLCIINGLVQWDVEKKNILVKIPRVTLEVTFMDPVFLEYYCIVLSIACPTNFNYPWQWIPYHIWTRKVSPQIDQIHQTQ